MLFNKLNDTAGWTRRGGSEGGALARHRISVGQVEIAAGAIGTG